MQYHHSRAVLPLVQTCQLSPRNDLGIQLETIIQTLYYSELWGHEWHPLYPTEYAQVGNVDTLLASHSPWAAWNDVMFLSLSLCGVAALQ